MAPPRTAMGTLRTHVARLRDDLGRDDLGAMIATEGDAYRLAVRHDDLDSALFERLLAEAGTLADPDAGMRRYDEALALWRDDAYVEFGDASFAVGERTGWPSCARWRPSDVPISRCPSGSPRS